MIKNTVSGSFLAKLFPKGSKKILENASQEEVKELEQEAAIVHQQLQAGTPQGGAAPVGVTGVDGPLGTAGIAAVPAIGAVIDSAAGATEVATLKATLTAVEGQLKAATDAASVSADKITALTNSLTAAESERDQYKAWYQKQAGAGKTLPGTDASNQAAGGESVKLSPASAAALAAFKKSQS